MLVSNEGAKALSIIEKIDNLSNDIALRNKKTTERIESLKKEKELKLKTCQEEFQNIIEKHKSELDIKKSQQYAKIDSMAKVGFENLNNIKNYLSEVDQNINEICNEIGLSPTTSDKDFDMPTISDCTTYIKDALNKVKNYYQKVNHKKTNEISSIFKSFVSKFFGFVFNQLHQLGFLLGVLITLLVFYVFFGFLNTKFGLTIKDSLMLFLFIFLGFIGYKVFIKVYRKSNLDELEETINDIYTVKNICLDLITIEEENLNLMVKKEKEKIGNMVEKIITSISTKELFKMREALDSIEKEYATILDSVPKEEYTFNDYAELGEEIRMYNSDLENSSVALLGRLQVDGTYKISIPFSWSNLVFNHIQDNNVGFSIYLQKLLADILNSQEFGNVKFTFVDPLELGESFRYFTNLMDLDVDVIDKKVYITKHDLLTVLDKAISHISHVIQNVLRDSYNDLHEFNSVSSTKVPYEFIIIRDFQMLCDDKEILQKLNVVLDKGVKCGVYVIIEGKNLNLSLLNSKYELVEIDDNYHLKRYLNKDLDMLLEIFDGLDVKSEIEKFYRKSQTLERKA